MHEMVTKWVGFSKLKRSHDTWVITLKAHEFSFTNVLKHVDHDKYKGSCTSDMNKKSYVNHVHNITYQWKFVHYAITWCMVNFSKSTEFHLLASFYDN